MDGSSKKKLIRDINIIDDAVKIVLDENNLDNRNRACNLVIDLVDRFYSDVEEVFNVKTKDYEILLDDIKLISRGVKIAKNENNPNNRKDAGGLVFDLIKRVLFDIDNIT